VFVKSLRYAVGACFKSSDIVVILILVREGHTINIMLLLFSFIEVQ
jgi:hypothetical protein